MADLLLLLLGLRVVAGPVELRGSGTLMRQTSARSSSTTSTREEITSGAFTDNPASLGVSRKVGYEPRGIRGVQRRPGELAFNQDFVLRPERLVRERHTLGVDGLSPFRRSIGVDPSDPTTPRRDRS